ncbi:tripartite tricarboxylate transporter permease [Fusibacter paucivorans]|uniref:Tripartite tricarboxylate transporter permease n=1 Tax=Fusibacter paucivorans TaxID=76009 RepID=A0ABS5PU91_9FIRM|nr:tripartite tricarboxylate transporter permease [Fusibacter paucivorans]MBS7527597.1 tripartite tricarboxylate transporter permease [Fusibacter paucivorans]
MIDLFVSAFLNLMTVSNILLMLVGIVVGIIFGAIPGLSSSMAIALFLPITFGLSQYAAFALLIALYIGGVSGGLISAILINVPGSAMSIATCYDGHPMAANGRAHRALGTGIVFSFIGTIFGVFVLIFAAPYLADIAVKLGPFEYFTLILFALMLIIGISGADLVKGITAGVLGMATTMVGLAPVDSVKRFTFGSYTLLDGFPLLPLIIGLFAVTSILKTSEKAIGVEDLEHFAYKKEKGWGFTLVEFFKQTKNTIVSAVIGVIIGFLPGMGGTLANQLAYATAQKTSKHPEKFGTGIMDGIVASETSNNASIGGAMIPLLALGIPGDGPTAMLLGAFTIQGLVAGPLLFKTSADLVYLIFAAMLVCSILMIVIEYYGIAFFLQAMKIPKGMLLPIIVMLSSVGAYASGNNMFNLWTVVIFGIVGFVFGKIGFPVAPFILGAVLGPNIESNLRRALQLSRASFMPFITRPVSLILLLLSLAVIISTAMIQRKKHQEEKAAVN